MRLQFHVLHLLDGILDLLWLPELHVPVHVWGEDVVVVVVFVVGLNFKQVVGVLGLLLARMLAQNVQFTAVVVDTFLTGGCSF